MTVAADRLTTIALCWRIDRRDGLTVALTDHDRDVLIDGVEYRAAPGMAASAITRSDRLDAETMEAAGALDTVAITERDLAAGRWDGARTTIHAVDWSDPGATPILLGEGTIGDVTMDQGRFAAELRGLTAALDRPVAEATSPTCRAMLGDKRCRVPMAGRRRVARVVSAAGDLVTLDGVEPSPNAWGDGSLRWLDGANAGLTSAVRSSAGAVLTLRGPPAFEVGAGALVRVTEGCDKRIATCAARFGNVVNFRGEPYLPGIDLLTRYPGA